MKQLFGIARDKKNWKKEKEKQKKRKIQLTTMNIFSFLLFYRKNHILLKIVFVKTCYNCIAVLAHGRLLEIK